MSANTTVDPVYENKWTEFYDRRQKNKALEAQAAATQDDAERARLFKEQNRSDPYRGKPWAEHPLREAVTWDQAKAWWPYRPILRANRFPKGKPEENIYAAGESGGRHSDPRKELAILYVVYEFSPTTTKTSYDLGPVWDNGAIFVLAEHSNKPIPFKVPGPQRYKTVTVRGREAHVVYEEKPDFPTERRQITWQETLDSGGAILWDITMNPKIYSEEESIRFVNEMQETRN